MFDGFDVAGEGAFGDAVGRGGPGLLAFGEFFVADMQSDLVGDGVDGDLVAGVDQGDGATDLCFGGDVADDEAVGGPGEASVGDEGDIFAQAGGHDGGGGGEHFGHAGSALGAFVTDDNDVAFENFLAFDGADHVFFTVVNTGGAGEGFAFFAGDLGDGAGGGEVAVEDAEVAGFLDGVIEGTDNVLSGGEVGEGFEVLGDGFSGNSDAFAVEEALFEQVFHDGGCAADAVEVDHGVAS